MAQAMVGEQCVGCVVNKLEKHNTTPAMRGYIAMLAVDQDFRNLKIGERDPRNEWLSIIAYLGTTLVQMAIRQMIDDGADEVCMPQREEAI